MKRMFSIRLFAFLSCTAAAVQAHAQDAVPSDVSLAAPSDEIVVTGRRRDENLQKVPISITAFGAAQLAQRGIRTKADLQSATSGL